MSSPIVLEWDEGGVHVTVSLDDTRRPTLDYDGGTVRFTIHTGQAWDLYEHVQAELGDWYREGAAQRANVAAGRDSDGVPLESADDLLDPRNPRYAENLRDLGDIMRKREKGE